MMNWESGDQPYTNEERNFWLVVWAVGILLILVLLTGCGSQPMLTVARSVDVPIRGTCIAVADIPATPTPADTKQEDEKQGVAALIVEVFEWTNYGRIADSLMRGCAK